MSDIICWLNMEQALDFIYVITKDGIPGQAVLDMIVLSTDDAGQLVLRWK